MPVLKQNFRNRIELSRQEMCIISQVISRDFSPRFFSGRTEPKAKIQFSTQELLEISRQISREYAPSKVGQQSRLVLLAVSPRRLHAYWHIAKRRLNQILKRVEQRQPMTLRIYAQPETEAGASRSEQTDNQPTWFDIAVDSQDGQQDIFLPEPAPTVDAIRYRAVLADAIGDQVFSPLAYSNIAVAPGLKPPVMDHELPKAIAQSIMMASSPASSAGKTASAQGK